MLQVLNFPKQYKNLTVSLHPTGYTFEMFYYQ